MKTIKEIIEPYCKIEIVTEKIRDKEYVTREMALDAGDPQLEGTLYADEEFEQHEELVIDFPAIAKEICEEIERMMMLDDTDTCNEILECDWKAFKKANGVE